MKVLLDTLGCRLNEAEIQTWVRVFGRAGHQVVSGPEYADVVVLNTCAVTREAARKSRRRARKLHRSNPSAPLVLTGCYAQLTPDQAREATGADLIVPNADKDELVARVEDLVGAGAMPSLGADPGTHHAFADGRTRAFVKVQDGCRNRCTFCVVTIARGEERSRAVETLVGEVAELVDEGCREVVLTGVHLGGYGHDLGTDLHRLVQTILIRTEVPRLRLSSLEPWELPEGFFELWKNPRLAPHLHLPIQSGS
ncbi:MAG: radical SAM protein, partial [Myxococcota bacterium]|nr:radical SAM protein [Myxococcota bacterium]